MNPYKCAHVQSIWPHRNQNLCYKIIFGKPSFVSLVLMVFSNFLCCAAFAITHNLPEVVFIINDRESSMQY